MFNKITCLLCEWQTTDKIEIDMINDGGLAFENTCPDCGGDFFKWESEDYVRVTLDGDYLETEKIK